jgi:hypothetical protein
LLKGFNKPSAKNVPGRTDRGVTT